MRASARRALSTARPARASDVSLDLPRVVAGQPTRATHPHVIASAADLTPGVSRAEYAARRAALARAMPPHSAAIFAAAPALRWPGTAIPAGKYRQDADFAYYTGVTQPDCVAVVERGRTEDDVRYALIVPKRCERHAQWDGERIDARAGETAFGADAAYEADERAAAYATEAVRNARGGVFVDLDKVDGTRASCTGLWGRARAEAGEETGFDRCAGCRTGCGGARATPNWR